MRSALALLVAGAVVVGFTGCGEATTDSTKKAAAAKPKPITLVTMDAAETTKSAIALKARVRPVDAAVTIDGRAARVDSRGRISQRVRLSLGGNTFPVTARKAGYETARVFFVATRNLSPAQRAERRRQRVERRRQRAERRRLRREAALAKVRSNAKELDPGLLQKDPDRYSGQTILIRGEIFQIQEGGDNFLLMNTECSTEYDITTCDGPTVYVGYPFSTDKKEDDIVSVYGTVEGGKEYDTAVGGSNYVAEVTAKIIE